MPLLHALARTRPDECEIYGVVRSFQHTSLAGPLQAFSFNVQMLRATDALLHESHMRLQRSQLRLARRLAVVSLSPSTHQTEPTTTMQLVDTSLGKDLSCRRVQAWALLQGGQTGAYSASQRDSGPNRALPLAIVSVMSPLTTQMPASRVATAAPAAGIRRAGTTTPTSE